MAMHFGDLRRFMNMRVLDTHMKSQLWALLAQARHEDSDVYDDLWMPYLSSFKHHLTSLWKFCYSLDELADAIELVPMVLFGLSLSKKIFNQQTCQELIQSPHLSFVSHLSLMFCDIGDDGIRYLAQSPYLTSLSTLDLWSNKVGDEGVSFLAQSPYCLLYTSPSPRD